MDVAGGKENVHEDFFVIDKEAPSDVSIIGPVPGIYIFGKKIPIPMGGNNTLIIGGPIKIMATATDDVMIDKVEFKLGAYTGVDDHDGNDDVWSFDCNGMMFGEQTIYVTAYDKAGQASEFEQMTVKVFSLGLR